MSYFYLADFRSSQNFQTDFSCSKVDGIQESFPPFHLRADSEKCIGPKPNNPEYQNMNGTCNPCCAKVTGSSENGNECVNQEKKSKIVSEIVERGVFLIRLNHSPGLVFLL